MADEIEMGLEEMKQKLQALATKYKSVRQEKTSQLGKTQPPASVDTQPKTEPAPSNGQLKIEFDKISAQVKLFQDTKDRDKREQMAFELGQSVDNWEDLYNGADESSKKAAAPLLSNVQKLKAQLGRVIPTQPTEGSAEPKSAECKVEAQPTEGSTEPKSAEGKVEAQPTEGSTEPKSAECKAEAQPTEGSTEPKVTSANVLTGSVGKGGENKPDEVKRVQNLLNRHGIRPVLEEDGKVGKNTIAAIEQFQKIKLNGYSDGLVEPNKNTWKALLGEQIAPTNSPANSSSAPSNNETKPVGSSDQLINHIATTGASKATASQDGLDGKGLTGVQVSQQMAKTDLERVTRYKDIFVKIGKEQGVPVAILAAIASRETRGKNVTGDHGHGIGIIQVDDRAHKEEAAKIKAKNGIEQIEESIRQGAIIFKKSHAAVKAKFPHWTPEQQLKGALAAYNFGVDDLRTLEGMDKGTTGNDYSSDVIARAQFMTQNGFAEESAASTESTQPAAGNANQTQPSSTPPQPVTAAKTLSASVGNGGVNKPEEVLLIKTLINKFIPSFNLADTSTNTKVGNTTIAAIKKFQQEKVGLTSPDGLIEPGKNTWKILNGEMQPVAAPPANGNVPAGGKIAHPNPKGRVTSPYGMRDHPIHKVRKMHKGVDIAAGKGSPIYAADAGRVEYFDDPKGYGFGIKVFHANGYSTWYCHLSSRVAPNGATVQKGDLIAKEGSTGGSTGSHLHFEVRKNGQHEDPMPYINGSKTFG